MLCSGIVGTATAATAATVSENVFAPIHLIIYDGLPSVEIQF